MNAGLIEALSEFEGVGTSWYVFRGFMRDVDFVSAILEEFGDYYVVDDVLHGYARYIPTGRKGEVSMHFRAEAGYGAFPITWLEA